jgi:hypothetical protein
VRQASRERQSITELARALRARREEIEAATLTRVFAVSDLPLAGGAEYAQGLRRAVTAALDYGLLSLERSGPIGSPPPVLLAQAALAARSGVGLDTVLRRYVAGQAILGDFVVEEDQNRLSPTDLKRTLRRLAAAIDRLVVAVSGAYLEESERRQGPGERRRAELAERLLAGEPVDASGLGYELNDWHLGLVASGLGTEQVLLPLARALDARLLILPRERGMVWAWLGRRSPLEPPAARNAVRAALPTGAALALGEPAEGELGWRLTHRQAAVALPVAQRGGERIVSYRDVALLATSLQDDLLATSLRHLYIEPLRHERDGGVALFGALHAYFASDRNVSSAAASLGVTRKTVNSRLRAVEERLGRPLGACDSDMQLALQIEAIHTV